ncbi:CTLH/CRA C-terminal to lish motif domain-containing protein [Entophlyctis helioformis]|nr:CTLH/CRA C-terminal to lish motif domain-containing protein [Entophlyctis helioformis]
MAAATSKKSLSRDEWERRLAEVNVSKDDLNKLIMNYLVIEGYKDAAEKFSVEAHIAPSVDLMSIQDRMNIRTAVQTGNIEAAIEKVNDLDPEILDTNPRLYFHLQQQKLIELIRLGRINDAIEFAQEELAPRGEENPEFLEELERTMALLAFDDTRTSPVGDLLDNSQRQKTASELNAAILTAQCQEKDPKLPSLLKMLVWAQNQLEEKMTFPKIRNLVTAELEDVSMPIST